MRVRGGKSFEDEGRRGGIVCVCDVRGLDLRGVEEGGLCAV